MLTIRAARSAPYYEAREFAREDYYAEHDLAPGRWAGREAEALGLAGAPARGELGKLLEGREPRGGERLPGLRPGRRNAGFDLTLTAPKSVSVLLAVGGREVRRAILAAHAAGARAALEYLERHELQARRGAGGQEIVPARGFAGAAYTHEMSRSGDPHLHTHVVVANAVHGPDGRYSAPDMRPVYHAAKTAGTLAEAVLRHELTRTLGVEWGEVRNGMADIAGIPAQVLAHFSSRHAEIAELAAARGSRGLKAVGAAQRQTRDRKPVIDRDSAQGDWRARASEQGFGRAELARVLDRAVGDRALTLDALDGLEARLSGPEGLTRQASTFTRRDVLRAYAEAHAQGAPLGALERLADDFLARRAVLVEPALPERGRRALYSTPDLLAAEERLLDLAQERGVWLPLPTAIVEEALRAHSRLGADQRAAVRHLAAGDGRVRLLEAHAGRGKTAALIALADAHRAAGDPLLATAWQGEAAEQLRRATGVPAETTARLLGRLGRDPAAVPQGAVLIVDEAGSMPTRALAALVEHVATRGGRLVLVGDRAQLPAIDAGGAFAALADRLGAAALAENRRQREPLQARVADLMADARAPEALALLAKHGALRSFAAPEDARAQLIGDWARAALPDAGAALIVAHDRADVRALNAMARAALDQAGLLGPERLVAGGREWAAGDRLVCRRNDYRAGLDVRNGTRGTVAAVDPEAQELTLRADDGRLIVLPPDYLEHAFHGYALTGHVSQGATVERTYLLASPERGGAEWAYVAASRHRIDLRVYLSADEPERAAEALAERWERRQAKHLATERLEAAAGVAREHGPAPARKPEAPAPAAETAPALGAEDPLIALRAERAALLAELRAGGPPDPSEALRRLGAKRALVSADLARVREERARAEAERAGIGRLRLLGRAGRAQAARLEGIAQDAGACERELAQDLRDIARERAAAEAQAAARAGFDAGLPALCRRLEALEAALGGPERPAGEKEHGRPRLTGPALALVAERQVLAEHLERGGPPDPSEELRRLGRELARLERDLAETDAWGQRVAARLEVVGPLRLLRSDGRAEVRHLHAELQRAEERAVELHERRAVLLGPLAAAQAQRAAREAWERAEAPVLGRRIGALDAEFARHAEERAQSAERERLAYLEHALGPRPEHERPLERWRQAVRELEGYRARHGITDPQRPLGPEPSDSGRAQEHRLVGAALESARWEIKRADPEHRSPFSRRGRLGTEERAEPWNPRPEPDDGPRHGPRHGPSLGMGL
jgi:conjugative relaxase-like TrwC/TraI family protein